MVVALLAMTACSSGNDDSSLSDMALSDIMTGLWHGAAWNFIDPLSVYYLQSYAIITVIAIVGATPLVKMAYDKLKDLRHFKYVEATGIFVLFGMSVAYLVGLGFDPFLYFRF